MKRHLQASVAAILALVAVSAGLRAAADEPKHGGILRMYHRESPASMSIHEEATFSTNVPAMADLQQSRHVRSERGAEQLDTIVPDLATSWAWSADNTKLTFKLREGVKWHDGVPFTAKDVKCTWDMLMGKSTAKFRKNPRKSWYENVTEITTNGDFEVTFNLKRPQPSLCCCWRRDIRRSIRATCRRPRCARTRSAPARSSSSSSRRTNRSS